MLGFVGSILQGQFLNLAPFFQRHKEKHGSLHAVLSSSDAGIAHAMTALVFVQWSLARFPSGIPYDSLLFPLSTLLYNVEIAAAIIHGNAIVTITGNAAELGVFKERVAPGGIRNQGKEVFIAKIVNPRPWCFRISNDILAMGIVEVTISFVVHILEFLLIFLRAKIMIFFSKH